MSNQSLPSVAASYAQASAAVSGTFPPRYWCNKSADSKCCTMEVLRARRASLGKQHSQRRSSKASVNGQRVCVTPWVLLRCNIWHVDPVADVASNVIGASRASSVAASNNPCAWRFSVEMRVLAARVVQRQMLSGLCRSRCASERFTWKLTRRGEATRSGDRQLHRNARERCDDRNGLAHDR